MKNYVLLILFITLLSIDISAQEKNEVILNSEITEVTVFLEGAQVTRKGSVLLNSGKTSIVLEELSPYIDEKSVQVKAEGNFTVVSVNHSQDYLNEREKDENSKTLLDEVNTLEIKIKEKEARLQVLKEKQSLLDKNKDLNGNNSSTNLTQLKAAIEFYDRELSSIKTEEILIQREIEALKEQKSKLDNQLANVVREQNLPSGKIKIDTRGASSTQASFTISYFVANAGWFPNYDVRVTNVNSPVSLNYKADVYQNTGEDWNDVKLKLSNASPNDTGASPELETWYLNYFRNSIYTRSNAYNANIKRVSGLVYDSQGLPLPGVNILVRGTSIGTQTDFDGRYQLVLASDASELVYSYIGFETKVIPISKSQIDVRMVEDAAALEEVVIVGYGNQLKGRTAGMQVGQTNNSAEKIKTTTVENQTTVEFEVEEPYTVPSNGEKLTVDLKELEIDASYEYYTVPKLQQEAYLIAKITNWDQYNLLEGEANLFFEDAYVGRTILEAYSLEDTLSVSLGRDKSIVIGREIVDEFSKRRTIGSNKIETREIKITIRNKKSTPILMYVYDQIPIAAINDIDVETEELSNGKLDEKTGEIIWELNLGTEVQKELFLKYEVKYPKNEKVILE